MPACRSAGCLGSTINSPLLGQGAQTSLFECLRVKGSHGTIFVPWALSSLIPLSLYRGLCGLEKPTAHKPCRGYLLSDQPMMPSVIIAHATPVIIACFSFPAIPNMPAFILLAGIWMEVTAISQFLLKCLASLTRLSLGGITLFRLARS